MVPLLCSVSGKKQLWPVKCDQTVRSMLLIRHSLRQHYLNQCSASVFSPWPNSLLIISCIRALVESLCWIDMSEPGHISAVWNRKCLVECAWGSVKTVMCNMLPLLCEGGWVCVCVCECVLTVFPWPALSTGIEIKHHKGCAGFILKSTVECTVTSPYKTYWRGAMRHSDNIRW